MLVSNAINSRCDWCRNIGLITAYHREYKSSAMVWIETVDSMGEVHQTKIPGTIAIHCSCGLGSWMRDRIEADIRERIPTLSDVINSRVPYQLDRPDIDAEAELNDGGRMFLRGWRAKFKVGQVILQGVRTNATDVANELRERTQCVEQQEGSCS